MNRHRLDYESNGISLCPLYTSTTVQRYNLCGYRRITSRVPGRRLSGTVTFVGSKIETRSQITDHIRE